MFGISGAHLLCVRYSPFLPSLSHVHSVIYFPIRFVTAEIENQMLGISS